MHIPDGYLSPSTCAALYAASAPFWAVAVRKMRSVLSTRFVPLVSLFAAFSFVIMMFNVPLPGGTTGHAAGVAIAAIVLGPWLGMLAITIALTIQALFFGDGGILALGANSFNIAIAGSLVAWAVYRLISGGSAISSRRRVLAAGIAGYAAMNVAAFLTAVQFGIQPALFQDALGSPLYAPYPLTIAVPAMMIGHLTIAGLAEGLVTAAILAWLQKSEPSILGMESRSAAPGWQLTRRAWGWMAILLLLTPLGLLTAGSAWGSWSADDFRDPAARQEIEAGSLGADLPAGVPAGIERFSSLWTAPVSDYAPGFMRSEAFGYILSAMFGIGLIIASTMLLRRFAGSAEPAAD
jgi:cobalt/nickel transport system permease protein